MVPRKVSQEVDASAPGRSDCCVTAGVVDVDSYEQPPGVCHRAGVSGLWRSGRVGQV